eukprot:7569555-Pyramimonas_sp.AAC.1
MRGEDARALGTQFEAFRAGRSQRNWPRMGREDKDARADARCGLRLHAGPGRRPMGSRAPEVRVSWPSGHLPPCAQPPVTRSRSLDIWPKPSA